MIPIFKPSMDNEEIEEVKKVIKSAWIGLGPKTEEFEKKFAEYIGTKYAIALNSGTAALQLALKVLNLNKGEEVITSAITFVATALSANYNNLNPIFADINEDTLNIDVNKIEEKITDKTRVIIPVHLGGYPCDMEELMEICKDNNLYLIEDCAHAAGSEYKEKKVGNFGKIGCFSFHAIKNLATGDGGMITTNDKEIYERLLRLRWFGIDKSTFGRSKEKYSWDYDVKEAGFKCHANDISSAIGLIQLKKLEKTNDRRREITKRYDAKFKKIKYIKIPIRHNYVKSACHNYVIKVEDRDRLIEHLSKNEISAGVHYKPLYLHTVYKNIKAECPVADKVWKKLITLPLYPDMSDEDIEKVINCVEDFYSSK